PYAVTTFDEKVACTFTGAAAGLQKFQEDFRNGGWASFIELARKENNQIGQTLIVAEEMAKIKSEKSAESVAKLNISKGFLAQEKCTITEVPSQFLAGEKTYSGVKFVPTNNSPDIIPYSYNINFDSQFRDQFIGKDTADVYSKFAFNNADDFKAWWISQGGEVKCKTVTPGEQISDLANKALQAPMKRLEDSITGLTNKLGTGAGSVIKPYVLAITNAGLNLLLKKEMGLITNALASAKKPRKARRQSTASLQENTMLAQSAGALAASMNDFRSFLLKAMLEFSLYVANATTALNTMDVLGRTPINKGEAELRGGTWELGGGCPAGYDKGNLLTFSGAPYSCAYDAAAVTTNHAGKTFFEEANWCGAYYQEIPLVTEKPPAVVTTPVENPVNVASIATTNCPRIVYFTPGTGTEITQSGVCNTATNQVTYDLNGDGTPEMITQLAAYDDKQTGQEDRFIRKNTVGAIGANGIPANIGAGSFVFEETLADSRRNVNHNSTLDTIATSTPGALQGLFEMRPYYTNAVTGMATTIATPRLPQGLAQAAIANDYVFGGYNQFGHSDKVFRLSDGTLVASLPIAISGSTAVYYPPNGRIYLFGGFDSAKAYATIWEFNPANQTFRTMSARLPASSTGLAGAYYSPNGRIYLFGGSNDGVISDQILEYNQATDTLVTKFAKFPSPVAFAVAATAAINPPTNTQQRIYVFGGILAQGFSSGAIFEYNPTVADDASALKRKSADIAPRGFIAAAPASANAIMLAGGQSEYGILATVEQYNAQNDSLTQMPPLTEPRSKAAGGIIGGVPVLVGGVMPIPAATAVSAESAKIFSQGDIYHIPAAINGEEIITPFWQKYFSSTFEDGSTTLLNTRTEVSYNDFTATVRDPAIATITNADSDLVWMSPPFYPELFEKIQELMEKSRIIEGYNYPATGVKNYQSGLADQLGATPDDDPYDNNPSNPRFFERDVNGNTVIEEQLGDWEGYKGSVTDT
ncbi:MAG: kelch repeat-containing protein, partial [Patescibacteria group bacterium]